MKKDRYLFGDSAALSLTALGFLREARHAGYQLSDRRWRRANNEPGC